MEPDHNFHNQSPNGKTKIDHSKNYIIGSPGFGRDEGDFIEDNMVYCMGGTGMIFSNQLIRSIRRGFNLILSGQDFEPIRVCFVVSEPIT